MYFLSNMLSLKTYYALNKPYKHINSYLLIKKVSKIIANR